MPVGAFVVGEGSVSLRITGAKADFTYFRLSEERGKLSRYPGRLVGEGKHGDHRIESRWCRDDREDEVKAKLHRVLEEVSNVLAPKTTPAVIQRSVQREFSFLLQRYQYAIHRCYFERFDYWGVALASYTERMMLWVSSQRYVTTYLVLPSDSVIAVTKVIARFTGEPKLHERRKYQADLRGIKQSARFMKRYYPTLRNVVEEMNWYLSKERLDQERERRPEIGLWLYDQGCWVKGDRRRTILPRGDVNE